MSETKGKPTISDIIKSADRQYNLAKARMICWQKCKQAAERHNTTALEIAEAVPDMVGACVMLIRAIERRPDDKELTVDYTSPFVNTFRQALAKAGVK